MGVITCPCHWYMLLTHKSSILPGTSIEQYEGWGTLFSLLTLRTHVTSLKCMASRYFSGLRYVSREIVSILNCIIFVMNQYGYVFAPKKRQLHSWLYNAITSSRGPQLHSWTRSNVSYLAYKIYELNVKLLYTTLDKIKYQIKNRLKCKNGVIYISTF